MSDDLGTDVGSSSTFSEEEVERARRVALSRLDELETSFERVSERLVSVEARLGELAEDLRVRVTALQQQTRDAVASSLESLAPPQPDLSASIDELRAVVRADVQEMAASIGAAFVEAENRLVEGQAALLERAATEDLRASLDALREQVAASWGTEELRASLDALRGSHEALREQLAASTGTEDLRTSLEAIRASQEALREQLGAPSGIEDLRGSLDTLREQVAAAKAEDLRESLDALREQVAASGGDDIRASLDALREQVAGWSWTDDLRASLDALRASQDALREQVATSRAGEDLGPSLEALREQVAASTGTEELRASVEAVREQLAAASTPEDLGASLDALRQDVAALASAAASDADGEGSGTMREVESALEALRSQIAVSTGAEELRQAVQALRAEMSLSKEGEELRAAIAALRQEVAHAGVGGGTSVEDVRAEVGVMARQLQERLVSLERAIHELRGRPVDDAADAGDAGSPAGLVEEARGPDRDADMRTDAEEESSPSAETAGDEPPIWAASVSPTHDAGAEVDDASYSPPDSGIEQSGDAADLLEEASPQTDVVDEAFPRPDVEIAELRPLDAEADAEPADEAEAGDEEASPPGGTEEESGDEPGSSKGRRRLPDLWSWGPKQG